MKKEKGATKRETTVRTVKMIDERNSDDESETERAGKNRVTEAVIV